MSTPVDITTTDRPQRADARRNRERISAAARDCFAARGLDAQIDEIAACAGVGVGTVYRHFPTKEALLHELVLRRFEQFAAHALEALEAPDAWEAFAGLLVHNAQVVESDVAMREAMGHPEIDGPAFAKRTGLADSTAELIRRAQAAGDLRPGVSVDDVGVIMCAVCGAMGSGRDWRRLLDLILDGLRA